MVANNQRGRHQGEQLVAVLHHGKMPCGCPLYLQKADIARRQCAGQRGGKGAALRHKRRLVPRQQSDEHALESKVISLAAAACENNFIIVAAEQSRDLLTRHLERSLCPNRSPMPLEGFP